MTAENGKSLFNIPPDEKLSAWLAWLFSPRGGSNFWGRILNGCDRRIERGMGTMAVAMSKRGKYTFLWDPECVKDMPDAEGMMTLVHEAAHLAYCHLERMLTLKNRLADPAKFRHLMPIYNIAADMVVNDIAVRPMLKDSKIKGEQYKDRFVFPENNDPNNPRRSYPPGKTFEEYVALLLEDLKKPPPPQSGDSNDPGKQSGGASSSKKQSGNSSATKKEPSNEDGEGGSGEGSEDDEDSDYSTELAESPSEEEFPQWLLDELSKGMPHIAWEKVFEEATDGEVERAIDNAHKQAQSLVRKAIAAHEKSCGSLPLSIRTATDSLLEEPKVPWQQVLRSHLRSAVTYKMYDSLVMPSMALISCDEYEPYPGLQPEMIFVIKAYFDTSGSMSHSDFRDCCSELAGIIRDVEGVSVRLIMFDAGLQFEANVSSDDEDLQEMRTRLRYGGGGTSFNEPMKNLAGIDTDDDWVRGAIRLPENPKADMGIMFTDGYAPMPEDLPDVPVIWCLTRNGREDSVMNIVVRMEDQ
jgi:predicted metal-dependent peptidase